MQFVKLSANKRICLSSVPGGHVTVHARGGVLDRSAV